MANDELMRLAAEYDGLAGAADMSGKTAERNAWRRAASDLRTLAQRAPQNGAVPEGCMLVRESMLRHWLRELNGIRNGNINPEDAAEHVHASIAAVLAAAPAPEAERAKGDVYEAYKTWPDDIRAKLSIHDLRRMSGWAPRTHVGDWRIDTSAGRPILVYQNCSVIEAETATYVLGLIARDAPPPAGQPEGVETTPHAIRAFKACIQDLRDMADNASDYGLDDGQVGAIETAIESIELRLASAQRAGKDAEA